MSEEPFNLVLSMLRDIRARQNEHSADLVEIKERLGLLEGGLASLSRRVDRIARRLELTDAPT